LVCDHLADPEILDLGLLPYNQQVPFTISTVGKETDYDPNQGGPCVNNVMTPDMVLSFEVDQIVDVRVERNSDTGDHVGVWYEHQRCEPCDHQPAYGYCYYTPDYWLRVGVQPGRYHIIIKPYSVGDEGTISGWIRAQ
jgi:hypothetical protein